jgi:hypothetical protein
MRGTRWYEHAHPQILSSTSGRSCNHFSCIKMKRFTITVFKIIKQREQSLKITFHHRRFQNTLRQGKFPWTFTGWLPGGCFIIRRRRTRTKQVQRTHRSPGHAAPTRGGRARFLAGNLNDRGSSLLDNVEPEDFTTNLLLRFTSLARASSCVEV